MRAAFFDALHKLMGEDSRIVLLIGDVGEYAARQIAADYPGRFYNLGISEQAIIGMAAGLARGGLVPVVYGIASFFVERAYEQIKLDIGLNQCRVILVTVGSGDEYAFEGPTHQCEYDIQLLRYIPFIYPVIPKTPYEIGRLLTEAANRQKATYIKL